MFFKENKKSSLETSAASTLMQCSCCLKNEDKQSNIEKVVLLVSYC